jgi:hypothetical protein
MKNATVLSALVLGLLLVPVAASAEQVEKFNGTEIHYNAMTTADLAPEVARAHDITRSKYRGFLTISILTRNKMGVLQPVQAKVTASAKNLKDQVLNLKMREVKEGTGIYYLADFPVAPPDTWTFNVSARVPGVGDHSFSFEQSYYP